MISQGICKNFEESRNLNESNQNNKKNFNTYKTYLTTTCTEIRVS